tara:strand:- start:3444 stop:4673 length:1230 start_codon:yes stop_codon:yes gene_type:complete
MKILIVCRLMSGFTESVKTLKWTPTGSPAIYKMIEGLLSREIKISIVFTAKEPGYDFAGDWKDPFDKNIRINGLNSSLTILSGTARIPYFFGRWRGHISNFRQTWKIWRIVKQKKPTILYVDRANIFAGAIVARFTKTKVVVRVLGITPSMKKMIKGKALSDKFNKWCYKSPFKMVIGSNDGSDILKQFEILLNPAVPREVRLNGVNLTKNKTEQALEKRTQLNIALVGRLDPLKRTDEVINAILEMNPEKREKVFLHVVGNGILYKPLKELADVSDSKEFIKFYGGIPHKDVDEILNKCEVYISLNAQGNLSNSNLEALAKGLVLILPEPNIEEGIDVNTYKVIPSDACIQLNNNQLKKSLVNTIEKLIDDPTIINKLKRHTLRARENLVNWEKRINWEIELLKSLIK